MSKDDREDLIHDAYNTLNEMVHNSNGKYYGDEKIITIRNLLREVVYNKEPGE